MIEFRVDTALTRFLFCYSRELDQVPPTFVVRTGKAGPDVGVETMTTCGEQMC